MRPQLYTLLIVAGGLAVLFAAENMSPLRTSRAGLLVRLAVNGVTSVLTFLVAAAVVRPSAIVTLDWASARPFGLIHVFPLPGWAQWVAGFVLLDLSFYYWHLANHKIPLLWRFHNVHHSDPDLDVSTGFRFHCGEVLFSAAFRVAQVGAIGPSLTIFAAYELVFQLNTLFHHSNLRVPIHIERLLNRFIVTPRMHGIHHSQVQRETNSNFGVVFCWWDHLHRTLRLNVPQSEVHIGIAGYSQARDNRLWHTFAMPFLKQRDYWRSPDGTTPDRDQAVLRRDDGRLAE